MQSFCSDKEQSVSDVVSIYCIWKIGQNLLKNDSSSEDKTKHCQNQCYSRNVTMVPTSKTFKNLCNMDFCRFLQLQTPRSCDQLTLALPRAGRRTLPLDGCDTSLEFIGFSVFRSLRRRAACRPQVCQWCFCPWPKKQMCHQQLSCNGQWHTRNLTR